MPPERRAARRRRSTSAAGAEAERRARLHYRLRAYRVLDANAWTGPYELDLVLRRGRTLVFCEVKSKQHARFGDALEAVGPEKQRRLRAAAAAWLQARPELARLDVRFDVVAVRGGRLRRLAGAF